MSRKTHAVARMLSHAKAQYGLGNIRAAEHACREALALSPQHTGALHLLSTIALGVGQADAALALSAQAIAKDASVSAFHTVRGRALGMIGQVDEAVAAFDRAIALDRRNAEAHYSRGHALCDLGRPGEAVASYQAACHLKPGVADIHNSMALALKDANRLDEAETCLHDALRLTPGDPVVVGNLALVLRDMRRHDEAVARMREALALNPDLEAEFHFNLAMVYLATGRLREGFAEMEWRWQMASMPPRPFLEPTWTGEALGGRTLLLHAEQGFGDSIQFCRYVPLVARSGRVILEVPRPLLRLMRDLPGLGGIVAHGDTLPKFDVHCPLMSLPHLLGTTSDTVPAEPSYLNADPAAVAAWHDRLQREGAAKRVGLVWASSKANIRLHRKRSMEPSLLAGLVVTPGVTFVSLQKDGPALPVGMRHAVRDWTADLHDFADTAALVAALDLVIGIDTAVIHLAGALGKPVWLLNAYAPEWRWLAGQTGSPWYPTLRQFGQPSPGDWPSVLTEAAAALRRVVAGQDGL